MDMNITAAEFKEWVKSQTHENITMSGTAEGNIVLDAGYAKAMVNFYDLEIVELAIVDNNDENRFYLHFQVRDDDHARGLYNEMIIALRQLENRTKVKVLLTCSSALTTSYFAQVLNQAVVDLKLDYTFNAVSFNHIYEKGFEYDVILLAPQIHFEYEKVKQIMKDQLVLKIPAQVFASYSAGGMLELLMEELQKKKAVETKKSEENKIPLSMYENEYRILTIGLINYQGGMRVGYRIYDHGMKTLDKEVIKDNYSPSDIEDLLDYITVRHRKVDVIGIAIPGVTYHGSLFHQEYHFFNEDLGNSLSEKYHIPVVLYNDVDAVAFGYRSMHEDVTDMVFHFQPRGMYSPGAGVILNGFPYRGLRHAAGEIVSLVNACVENPEEKIKTPEGALEIVGKCVLAYISVIAPKNVIVYSEMTPDMDVLREWLLQYVDEKYIPELRHVYRLKKYMLPGVMLHCLWVLENMKDWVEEKRKGAEENA